MTLVTGFEFELQISYRPGQASLIIKRMQLQHKHFLCVTEGISKTESAAFNPNTKMPASVLPFVNDTVDVVAGSDREFQCHVTGDSPVNVTWFAKFDNHMFSADDERRNDSL